MWTNEIKTKSLVFIQIEHSFHCLIYPTNNTMVSLKDGFTVWLQSQKEDFLSTINYINVLLSMMPGHGANPIFLIKKIKIGRLEHSLTPHPPTSNNISFLPCTLLPLTPKVEVICVSLPISVSTIKSIIISKFCPLKFWINNRLIFCFSRLFNVVIPLDNGSWWGPCPF